MLQKDTEEEMPYKVNSKHMVHWASSMECLGNRPCEGRSPRRPMRMVIQELRAGGLLAFVHLQVPARPGEISAGFTG